ncbi:MAG: anthranilate synthase component I family protein [Bacteroidota bacterium]|nr:anthranilate synthase component I family protein [Bacteroidota bacterium]
MQFGLRQFIPEEQRASLREKVLSYGARFSHVVMLENRGEEYAPSWLAKGWIAGIGCHQEVLDQGRFFDQLKEVRFELPLLGYLGYDLKNQVEDLHSNNADAIGAPDASFFEPVHYLHFDGAYLSIASHEDPVAVGKAIEEIEFKPHPIPTCKLIPSISKSDYLEKVEQVIEQIRNGEVYEMNLCVEHLAKDVQLDPISCYLALMEKSEVPFAAFLKRENIYAMCASPERFLRKQGEQLLTQPIKGTRRRGKDAFEDEQLRKDLLHSEKDRAENVMIVDLVRNDLTRSCRYGSIEVEELFGIYSFKNVHQMISTVSGQLRPEVHWADAIRMAFPMGSMTGAPKIRAMQLIEEMEESKRGIYSGSIGVIFPNQDFELNVVIRTVLYNEKDSVLSVHAGGAITYDSKAEEEYDEIQTKLSLIYNLFAC